MGCIPPASHLCRSPVSLSPTQEEKCLPPRWQANFSRSRPWRRPQKNKLSKRQSDGSQVAYFRDLLIPRWQERVSDVPLASVLFGSELVSFPSGERGGMGVRSMWLRNESPKKSPPPLPRGSTGTLLQQQLFKVLWYFSPPLMFIYFFVVLECWKLTHAAEGKLLFLHKSSKQVDCLLHRRRRRCCFQFRSGVKLLFLKAPNRNNEPRWVGETSQAQRKSPNL